MRIGQLALQAGVTASRIRFYEKIGLLPAPARRTSGYRDYDEGAVELIRFIILARDLDFTLEEIAAHLAAPQGAEQKLELRATMENRLRQLDGFAARVETQRVTLRALIAKLVSGDLH